MWFTLLATGAWEAPAAEVAKATPDYVGPGVCAECHHPMHDTWMRTAHHDTFFTMHRSEPGRDFAKEFGLLRIKQDSLCFQCHYTPKVTGTGIEALAGVSCESCHGPASEWNHVHSNLTDPQHLEKAAALGMIRPSNTYAMVSRCYDCHTVGVEELQNRTYHPSGRGFEMVAWLEGEVRHNFMNQSPARNRPTPVERQRILYVVGKAAELEHSLRGLASAHGEGRFTRWMQRRVESAIEALKAIKAAVDLPEIAAMLEATTGMDATPGVPSLTNLADKVGSAARDFVEHHDGKALAALDSLLPTPESYIGTTYQP